MMVWRLKQIMRKGKKFRLSCLFVFLYRNWVVIGEMVDVD